MSGGLVDSAIRLFERRFLTNAFLPVLLFAPALLAPVLLQHGRLRDVITRWDRQSGALQLLEIIGYLAFVWFVATIVASQWRNITQLFEGYRLDPEGAIGSSAIKWHRARRNQLAILRPQDRYYYYAERDTAVLPTRLGNILRAAEFYPLDRYNAELILLWPRLYRTFPAEFSDNIEDAKARLEFLLVVSLWCAVFGVGSLIILSAVGSPSWLVASCFAGGMLLAYSAYVSALPAAIEYGDRLRAGFDLYRHDLLARLKLRPPTSIDEERRLWLYLFRSVVEGTRPATDAEQQEWNAWRYWDPGPPETRIDMGAALLEGPWETAGLWLLVRRVLGLSVAGEGS